jgi:putative ABC transport system substrate-binding protein
MLGGAAAWPRAARAQQTERIRRSGVLAAYAESDPEGQARVGAFNEALKALGWANEHNVRIDYRWPDTDIDRTRIFASELVALRPDVLLATNTTSARALRSATQTIPTVFVTLSDPVGTGIISNLANPEANITGFPNYEYSLVGKWMTLLRTVNPRVSHVALLYNPMAAAFAPNYFRAAEDAGRSTGIKLISASVQSELEIEHFIAQLASDSAGGLIALPDIFMNSRRALIVSLAARYRVPAIYYSRVFAVDGGLLSYVSMTSFGAARPMSIAF